MEQLRPFTMGYHITIKKNGTVGDGAFDVPPENVQHFSVSHRTAALRSGRRGRRPLQAGFQSNTEWRKPLRNLLQSWKKPGIIKY